MGLDLSKLTPAPWVAWRPEAAASNNWGGKAAVAGLPILSVDRSPAFRDADAEFIALARNAFDVMMRRGWNPSLNGDGSWGVVMMITLGSAYRAGTFDRHVSRYPDPFTALVEADRWYKENIEAADGHEA